MINPRLAGFVYGLRTSGNQYKNAAIAGKLMAGLVEYCEGGADHDTTLCSLKCPIPALKLTPGFIRANAR